MLKAIETGFQTFILSLYAAATGFVPVAGVEAVIHPVVACLTVGFLVLAGRDIYRSEETNA